MTISFKIFYNDSTGEIKGIESVLAQPSSKFDNYSFIGVSLLEGLEIGKDHNNYNVVRNPNNPEEMIIGKKEHNFLRIHDSYFYKIPELKHANVTGIILEQNNNQLKVYVQGIVELGSHILHFYITKKDDPDFLIQEFEVSIDNMPTMIDLSGLSELFSVFTKRIFHNYYLILNNNL
jgi:hypothetical protein